MPPISVALIRKRAEHNEGCVSTLEVRITRSRCTPARGGSSPGRGMSHEVGTRQHVRYRCTAEPGSK